MVRDAISPADAWGPFDPKLLQEERRARLRSLHAIVRLCCGPRADGLCRLLAQAEYGDAALELATQALDGLPSLDRRRVLSAYAALHRAVLAA